MTLVIALQVLCVISILALFINTLKLVFIPAPAAAKISIALVNVGLAVFGGFAIAGAKTAAMGIFIVLAVVIPIVVAVTIALIVASMLKRL